MSGIDDICLANFSLPDGGEMYPFDFSPPKSTCEYTESDSSPLAKDGVTSAPRDSEPDSTKNSPQQTSPKLKTSDVIGKSQKCRKAIKRTAFSRKQVAALEARFMQQSFLCKEERYELSQQLNITERQVMIWFQNRRGRLKKRGAADAAYNPLKLSELNTRRPYPFLSGMLSSIHYQKNSSYQQMWSTYPDEVRNAAQTGTAPGHGDQPQHHRATDINETTLNAQMALNMLPGDPQKHCQQSYAAQKLTSHVSPSFSQPCNMGRLSASGQWPTTPSQAIAACLQSNVAKDDELRHCQRPASTSLTMTSSQVQHTGEQSVFPLVAEMNNCINAKTYRATQYVRHCVPAVSYVDDNQTYPHLLRANLKSDIIRPPRAHQACDVTSLSPVTARPSCSVGQPSSTSHPEYLSSFSAPTFPTIDYHYPHLEQICLQASPVGQMDKMNSHHINWAGCTPVGHAPTAPVNPGWHQTPYQLIPQH